MLISIGSYPKITIVAIGCHSKGGELVLKKATEYGAVEIWMNERVRRACASSCADFVYGFLEVLLSLPNVAKYDYSRDNKTASSTYL